MQRLSNRDYIERERKDMRNVFLDAETTGLTPGQISQISIIITDESGNVGAKNFFFEVEHVDEGAEKLLGRGVDFYKQASNGEKFGDRASELLADLQDSKIIAHNSKFDINFVSAEFWRLGTMFKPTSVFDTMEYFKDIVKIPSKYRKYGKYKNPKLEEVVSFFNISLVKAEKYCRQLYGISDSDSSAQYHDSRMDTTLMFLAFQMERERITGMVKWTNLFKA